MTIRTDFPHRVEVIDHTWITLADGTRLAARVWMPEGAADSPVPVILEYLPYRFTDGTVERDTLQHPWFAGHGYAVVRVDMRGSGNSDGIMYDEYLQQEQDDALEILAWIAGQPWSDGNVGIIGISWGGFNGLQIAARQPPELKAVITLCSTDDRYADDVHYVGGCLNASDQLAWASTMLLYNAKPPLPWVVGDDWRETWFKRIDETPPWIDAWMTHQRRDKFWQHGSICEDYTSVECPVLAVGGWSDGYSNAVLRMLEHLECPRKGLLGPWAHAYPEIATPGPRIGFLQECLRWWDHWLKGHDTGVEDDPDLRVWMPDALEPAPHYDAWPGRWVAEASWPPSNEPASLFPVAGGRLESSADEAERFTVEGSLLHGKHAGQWCPYGIPGDFPGDQREEDGLCLTFDSAPLSAPMEILGFPELHAQVSSDQPQAMLVARLCDVWPDGRSTLITRGLLNLSHRDSHEQPEPLEPGQTYDVRFRLNGIAWSLPPGHRLRLALSTTYWPWAWPSPEPATLEIAACRLDLPAHDGDTSATVEFEAPETAAPLEVNQLSPATRRWQITTDPVSGQQTISIDDHQVKRLVEQELVIETSAGLRWSITDGDPLSATNIVENSWHARRGDWDVRVETQSTLSADRDHFHLTTFVEAFEDGVRVRTHLHNARIPRDNV